jgi:hypothetical protein
MTAAAESLDPRGWPDDVVTPRRAPQERLEEALGRDFARLLIAALVGPQAPREPS